MLYIKNTDSALTPYMIAHLQQTFPREYDHILRQINNETRVPWDREFLALDKRPRELRPRGLLSSARDSISHRTLVFILYPLHSCKSCTLLVPTPGLH